MEIVIGVYEMHFKIVFQTKLLLIIFNKTMKMVSSDSDFKKNVKKSTNRRHCT